MPSYDYKCTECGYTFEEFQSINATPLIECPKCSKPGLKRLLHGGAGLIFKGTGFYLTDYKNNVTKKTSDSSNTGEKKSEAKPESTQKDTAKKEKPETTPTPPAKGK